MLKNNHTDDYVENVDDYNENAVDILIKVACVIVEIYPVIIVVGSISNVLALILFSAKKFHNTIFSTYFRFLLACDTYTILILATFKYLRFKSIINVRNVNDSLCKLTMFFTYTVPVISAWILVAISFDRLMTILKPTQFLFRKKTTFQVMVCIGIIIFNTLYYSPLLFSYTQLMIENNTPQLICLLIDDNAINWMDLFNSTLVPFSLMIIFTSITIKIIFHSRRKLARLNTSSNLRYPIDQTDNCTSNYHNSSMMTRKRDIKFAITSITLNSIFLILNVPFGIYSLVIGYTDLDSKTTRLLDTCLLLVYYMNSGTVFFINWAVNSVFRYELYRSLGIKKKRKQKIENNKKRI
jgi:hypothetical protein